MKLNLGMFMAVIRAIAEVERTVKGGQNKRDKVIEIVATGVGTAGALNGKVREGIGEVVDAVVKVQNTMDGR